MRKYITEFDPFNLVNSFILYGSLAILVLPLLVLVFVPDNRFLPVTLTDYSAYFYFYAFLSFAAFLLGARVYSHVSNAKIRALWAYRWDSRRTLLVFGFVFVGGLAVKAIRILNGGFVYLKLNPAFTGSNFYSLIGTLDWFGSLSLIIALIAFFNFKKGDQGFLVWKYLVWLPITTELAYALLGGSRGAVLVPLVAILIVYHYLTSRNILKFALSFIVLFFLLMPLLNIRRSPEVFFHEFVAITRAGTSFPKRISEIGRYVFGSSFFRVEQSRPLLAVLQNTTDFNYGDSIKKFFISLGPPRFIWKNKPLIHGSMSKISARSGLLAKGDTTSVGPTAFGDWYMNFGALGIVFGMFLYGILFKFLSQAFIVPSAVSSSGLMLYAVTWLHTFPVAVEGWIAPLWAGYIKLFVILFVVHLALKSSNREYMNRTQIYK